MRLGLLADIHGNIHALEACLERLRAAEVDEIVCAGDTIGYYPFANEVVECLQRNKVTAIRGNHEAYLLGAIRVSEEKFRRCSLDWIGGRLTPDHRVFLERLPESHAIDVAGTRVSMFHGSPWSVEEYVHPNYQHFDRFADVQADVIILGHTHVPMVRNVGRQLIVNAGSCGQPRDNDPRAACAVLDTHTRHVDIERVDYDVEAVCERVVAEGLWSELASILKRTDRRMRGSEA